MRIDVEITGTDKLMAKAYFPTPDFLENPHDVSEMAYQPACALYNACKELRNDMTAVGASYIMPEFPLYYFYPYCSYKLISEIINEADKCLEALAGQFPVIKAAFSYSSDNEILDYIEDHLEGNTGLPGIYLVELKLEIESILIKNNRVCDLVSRVFSSYDIEAIKELYHFFHWNKKLSEYYGGLI